MIEILGQTPSKSNTYRIITMRRKDGKSHGSLAKTDELKAFENSFIMQLKQHQNPFINGAFEFYGRIYFRSWRSDLDNSLKVVLDCLQSAQWIDNDNNCVKIVCEKKVDANNPRIHFMLKSIQV